MVFVCFEPVLYSPDVSRKVMFEYLEIYHSSVTSPHDSDVIQLCTRVMKL